MNGALASLQSGGGLRGAEALELAQTDHAPMLGRELREGGGEALLLVEFARARRCAGGDGGELTLAQADARPVRAFEADGRVRTSPSSQRARGVDGDVARDRVQPAREIGAAGERSRCARERAQQRFLHQVVEFKTRPQARAGEVREQEPQPRRTGGEFARESLVTAERSVARCGHDGKDYPAPRSPTSAASSRASKARAMNSTCLRPRLVRATLCALAAAALLTACSEESTEAELSAPRDANVAAGDVKLGASTHERMGTGPIGPTHGTASKTPAPATTGGNGGLVWDTPAGWSELAPTSMRVANFRVAGDERAECYLTLLGGDAGGLAANVNRWRGQMSQPPLSAAELAKLSTKPMLGGEAVLVDFGGAFGGMGGGAKLEDARLVGLLLFRPEGAAFLKMTGPASTIGGQIDAFLALAASLRN